MTIPLGENSDGKKSVRRKYRSVKIPFGENSVRRKFRSVKIPSAKIPSVKIPLAKILAPINISITLFFCNFFYLVCLKKNCTMFIASLRRMYLINI